jgi:uncharacterized protein YjbJ (UPF0337 family)
MDKDRVEGKVKDAAGRVQRQVGEWTNDEEAQAKGTAKQVEGKVQNTWGKMKDAARDAADETKHQRTEEEIREDERKRNKEDAA